MTIRLNGETRELRDGLSIAGLLDELGLSGRRLAVERNRDVVSRDSFATTVLCAGDVVEVVQFVGGG